MRGFLRGAPLALLIACSQTDPASVEEEAVPLPLESVELLLSVEEEGEKVTTLGVSEFAGRRVLVSVDGQAFHFDPADRVAEELRDYMRACVESRRMSPTGTTARLTATDGIVYADVILALDVLIDLGFEKVTFAGTQASR